MTWESQNLLNLFNLWYMNLKLEKLAEIAVRHNVYVASDEIWYDIVMPGHKHIVLSTINEVINDLLITRTSPSKSFNIAGMMVSNIIILNETIREKLEAAPRGYADCKTEAFYFLDLLLLFQRLQSRWCNVHHCRATEH